MNRPAADARFRVMGSDAHVVVTGDGVTAPRSLVERAVARLQLLEARWSRFLEDSELNVLNRAAGAPCVVSADTATLVATLVDAWARTGGRFDPTVHDAVVAAGYDRSFELLDGVVSVLSSTAPGIRATPGCAGIDCDGTRGVVQLPAGVHLDPGGLGKGLAADLVVAELLAAGAAGVLVNLGGDLRATGRSPHGDDWIVAVEGPDRGAAEIARIGFGEGAVATTTSARRRWSTPSGAAHHVIDPATGRPADTARRQVTVVAGVAWWAEVLATVAFLDGSLLDPEASALVVDDDGRVTVHGDPSWFLLTGTEAGLAEEVLT